MNQEHLRRRIAAQQAKTETLVGQLAVTDAAAAKARRLLLGSLLEARLADLAEADRAREFRDLETRASKRDRLKLEHHPLRPANLRKLADEKEASKPAGK